ncbi:MAG TPA: hypothetical protein VK551_07095 [Thermodesulfobacteriota bacterium]|nr:hypothetical protein [Thermodesulfobacteriota bacterium]
MAKSILETGPSGNAKRITLTISGKDMIIKRPKDGDPMSVEGHDQGPIENLVIDGKKIPNVFPDDTVIFTHHSPRCGYYYFNGKWWYR